MCIYMYIYIYEGNMMCKCTCMWYPLVPIVAVVHVRPTLLSLYIPETFMQGSLPLYTYEGFHKWGYLKMVGL